ncbi:MAG: hypothetical protein IPL31_17530 [Saprospiraceae bacterium]|nr:hypothetical protein [Saprospiraceae bacterium]
MKGVKNTKNEILDSPLKKRVDFSELTEFMATQLPSWDRVKTEPKSNSDSKLYNEFTYFYPFIRELIYDQEDHDLIRNYTYQKNDLKYYCIDVACKEFRGQLYLDIEAIDLHMYSSGVGMICFKLANKKPEQSTADKILLINEFGRRIYPQFLDEDGSIKSVHANFLAHKIILLSNVADYKANDEEWNLSKSMDNGNAFFINQKVPKFIHSLFIPEKVIFSESENGNHVKHLYFCGLFDDRMFFISWYGNDSFSEQTGKQFESSNWWYSYVFGDKKYKSIANDEMQRMQLRELHTYSRWKEFGTLFGISRDSFVSLSASKSYLNANKLPPIYQHTTTVYSKMALINLMQRATVLKFQNEKVRLLNKYNAELGEDNPSRLAMMYEEARYLYLRYFKFSMNLNFDYVAWNIQAIELYTMIRKVMKIDEDVSKLKDQIQELAQFIESEQQRRILEEERARNINGENLNMILLYTATIGIMASLFGSSLIEPKNFKFFGSWDETHNKIWLSWLLIIALGGLCGFGLNKRLKILKKKILTR